MNLLYGMWDIECKGLIRQHVVPTNEPLWLIARMGHAKAIYPSVLNSAVDK